MALSYEKRLLEQVLGQLLPEHIIPLVDPQKRAVVFIWKLDLPRSGLELFTPSEWEILLALADSYPHYSPYELLVARHTATAIEHSRKLIHEAREQRVLRQELRSISEAISSIRRKLRPFLTVALIHGTGYLLAACPSTT